MKKVFTSTGVPITEPLLLKMEVKGCSITCWGCGKEGVVLSQCVNDGCIKKFKAKQTKKPGLAVKRISDGEQHFNTYNELNDTTMTDDGEFIIDEYCGYHVGNEFHQSGDESKMQTTLGGKKIGDTMILLDSQSTHSTFYARHLVNNIRDASRPLRMVTNGGEIIYKQQADLPDYGTVWFNENSIANIISMSEAERKGHKISYSPGCLTLTNAKNGHTTDFRITSSGLYAYNIPLKGTNMIQTVGENEHLFTPRQVILAQKARELYKMIGRLSYNDYIAILKNNLLLDAKITPRDILHAEAIYGRDLGSLQGKTTRRRPTHVITDYIHVPEDIMKHHKSITLSGDIMAVGGITFLITASRNIQFTTVEKLDSKTSQSLKEGLMKVINSYKNAGLAYKCCY
jgi:hypothetical protein